MEHLSAWVGAGVVTAGLSAALLTGAGAAGADTDSGSGAGSDGGGASTSDSSKSTADASDSAKPDKPTKPAKPTNTPNPGVDKAESSKDDAADKDTDQDQDAGADESPGADTVTEDPALAEPIEEPVKRAATKKKTVAVDSEPAALVQPSAFAQPSAVERPAGTEPEAAATLETVEIAVETLVEPPAGKAAPTTSLAAARTAPSPAVAPVAPSLIGVVSSVISTVVKVASFAVTALQAVEALVTGPPVLPPRSTVTVRSSTIELSNGQRIEANWYYPKGDTPPDRMILLQHGFLALGPMYSYTAANLAERTNSIVVTPSIPSNPLLGDDHWLGGTGMASEIAELFRGDRAALTQSAIDAGFATRYGLHPETAKLPKQFALMGHSLGGNLVPAVAGLLARDGGADNLVGVITLDGVPSGGTMATALDELDKYEARTGRYIPIREIGAPWNLFNSISNINEALTDARPDHFNGVVLTDGVHMDSMQGGNPLIQFAAYLIAGFPKPQNPPAVEELAVQWLDEWFNGRPFVGDKEMVPGSTFDVDTPAGSAEATVIGNPRALRSLGEPFATSAPEAIPSPRALLTRLAV